MAVGVARCTCSERQHAQPPCIDFKIGDNTFAYAVAAGTVVAKGQ